MFKKSIIIATISSLQIVSLNAYADILSIPNYPLSVGPSSVDPNMMFVIDDSGSMDWSVLVPDYYEYCNYMPSARNAAQSKDKLCGLEKHTDSNFYFSEPHNDHFHTRDIKYIFDHKNEYNSKATVDYLKLEETDWRIFDSHFNLLNYNPDSTYVPWNGPCHGDGSTKKPYEKCTDASFTAVRAHPKEGHPDYDSKVNIGDKLAGKAKYAVSIDDKQYTGSRPDYDNIKNGSNGSIDPWDTHAIFNFTSNSSMNVKLVKSNNNAEYETFDQINLSGNACYNILGTRSLIEPILKGSESIATTNGSGCRTISEVQQNYANWYQYYRRKSFVAKHVISYIVNLYPTVNYGFNYINEDKKISWPISLDNNKNKITKINDFLNEYYLGHQHNDETPLIQGLNTAGEYYMGKFKENPIIADCQRNYAIAFTDGYWSQKSSERVKLGDVDGDGYGSDSSTLSDIARYYYVTDLSSIPNNVTALPNDPATYQHMVTFGIGFGVNGVLKAGKDGWPTGNLGVSSDWGDPNCADPQCGEKIDDLWHAAYNSKGKFFQSNNLEGIQNGLNTILNQVVSNFSGSSASLSRIASDTAILSNDPHIYQATFNAESSSGDLTAYKINSEAIINTLKPVWKASEKISRTPHYARTILSYANNKGIAFRWPQDYQNLKLTEFENGQVNMLLAKQPSSYSDPDIYGKNLIDYIRGDKSKEENTGIFRKRDSIMGDIIHSSPIMIAPPNSTYTTPSYILFKQKYQNRSEMIAVGANDGMLHIINAKTGFPLMSYVPGYEPLLENLGSYAASNYSHTYFVDATPNVADIQFSDNQWKTVLIGSLGRGGQSIYALDITTGSFSESSNIAEQTVLWEFSDKNDPDLGNVLGTPQIAKMANGRWAAILGNGYNSSKSITTAGQNDTNVSKSRKAHLFILFIEKGIDGKWVADEDYIKIPVGKNNDNGLSEPFPVDIDGDYVVDYIYAGDLNGTLWKFDVRSSDTKNWTKDSSSIELFRTTDKDGKQPITTAPIVTAHPGGLSQGMMIYFGTGKWIENTDNTQNNQETQAFYGIWDKNEGKKSSFHGYGKLLKQEIVATSGDLRAVTNNAINWTHDRGWYIELLQDYVDPKDGKIKKMNYGERVITQAILRNGRVIFTTLIPANENAQSSCSGNSPDSWIMELNASNGGYLSTPPFDINADGVFNSDDYITYINSSNIKVSVPHGGKKSKSGFIGAPPTVLTNPLDGTETKIINGSNGISTEKESVDPKAIGRQSWQQVN